MNHKQQLVMDAFREIDTIAFEEYRDSDSKLDSIQSLLYQVQECLDDNQDPVFNDFESSLLQ